MHFTVGRHRLVQRIVENLAVDGDRRVHADRLDQARKTLGQLGEQGTVVGDLERQPGLPAPAG